MTNKQRIALDWLYRNGHNPDDWETVDYIRQAIEGRHGTWCGTVCSACGESVSWFYDCEYCPMCGAEMDGGTEEE